MALKVIILAAGQGKRMHSDRPKVLHEVGGISLLQHVIRATTALQPTQIFVVYGHQGERLRSAMQDAAVTWVHQEAQLGTGHAALCCLSEIHDDDDILILAGDVPLIKTETLATLVEAAVPTGLGLIVAVVPRAKGLGRIIRDAQHRVIAIVEEKDASVTQQAIKEINSGIIFARGVHLKSFLPRLSQHNSQQEYYLTDIFDLAVNAGVTIADVAAEPEEVIGVNTCEELVEAERLYQRRRIHAWMMQGLRLQDPARFDVRGEFQFGRDVSIDINVLCEGQVILGNRCVIEPNVILRNVQLGDNVRIKAFSHIEDAIIGKESLVGPFARIRPGAVLQDNVHIGNFVEIKKSQIDSGSKISHLSYIGDTVIGKNVNIGAGTITCNYDGANKHQTIIEDDVFIGSDTQLIAPVMVGRGATVGAGTTITKDVSPDELVIDKKTRHVISGWKRPKKKGD